MCSRLISSMIIGIHFYKMAIKHNCPTVQVIENQDECMVASEELGLTMETYWLLNPKSSSTSPAGCYWRSGKKVNKTFFNSELDPSMTLPNSFSNRGGVCKTTGRN